MSLIERVFGRTLASHEEEGQKVGPLAGVPMLGLDALASAAYGPEATLTLLLPLGALGLVYIGPITFLILALLAILYFSYRQTIAAYPTGGGSYTVAKENLGVRAGLVAAAQRVEHYEMAGYGCARTYAMELGDKHGAQVLATTLREESETDKKLSKIAKSVVNLKAKKAVAPPKPDAVEEVGKALKKVVKKITG